MSNIPTSYNECQRIASTRKRKLAPNTTLVIANNYFAIRFHATEVVRFFDNHTASLHTGGYHTVTTKERINAAGFGVYQRDFQWYLAGPNGDITFIEGMTVSAP